MARIRILAIGSGLLGLLTLATHSLADLVEDRAVAMKQVRRAYRELLDMARSDTFDPATAKTSAAQVQDALARFQKMFPAGSQGDDKAAKSEIWSNRDGFDAAWSAADRATGEIAAASNADGFKSAFDRLAGACKGCHQKFVRQED